MKQKGSQYGLKPYFCRYAPEPINVDGELKESAWQKVAVLDFFIPVTGAKPESKTEGRVMWDRDYLYVGFKAYDKDIWGYYTERDASTCNEDVLEVFLKTDVNQEPYYNFEINALGTVYDAFNIKRGAGGGDHHRWSRWNCRGLKVAVKIQGTLNSWEDVDEYWQMEVAIPFAALPNMKGKVPVENDVWLFHLSRYDYSVYLPKGVELSSCAPFAKVDFHRYEDWLELQFAR